MCSIMTGAASAVYFIGFVAWLDMDVLNQSCLYDECPFKYDIVYVLSILLLLLTSFLQGYLVYRLCNKIWKWDKVKNATS